MILLLIYLLTDGNELGIENWKAINFLVLKRNYTNIY